jgi:hypothetical protein
MDKEQLNTFKELKVDNLITKGDLFEEYQEIQQQEYLNKLRNQRKPILRVVIETIRSWVTT